MPTHLKTSVAVALLILVSIVGFWLLRYKRSDAASAQESGQSQIPPSPPAVAQAAGEEKSSVTSPLLTSLREAYRTGATDPVKLRLQGQLETHWERKGFATETVFAALGDPSAPADYRDFLGRRLRNYALTRDAQEREALAGRFRDLIERAASHPHTQGDFASALMRFDHSDATVDLVAKLLHAAESDQVARLHAQALALAHNGRATDHLQGFVAQQVAKPNSMPQSLATAIPPLTDQFDLPLEPLLTTLAAKTHKLFHLRLALASLSRRPATAANLAAIEAVAEGASRLQSLELQAAAQRLLQQRIHDATGAPIPSPAQIP